MFILHVGMHVCCYHALCSYIECFGDRWTRESLDYAQGVLSNRNYKVTEKTFQEMYINVGMANCEKRPKKEWDDIRFTHIAMHPYIFLHFFIEVCVRA